MWLSTLCFLPWLLGCQSFVYSSNSRNPTVPFIPIVNALLLLTPPQTALRLGNDLSNEPQVDEEEILLKVSLSINDKYSIEDATPVIQNYMTSFPFSAVLPVQPLTYTPRDDGMGVKVAFLRKKTQEKSSYDGGIDFLLSVDEDEKSSQSNRARVNIVATRVSKGQFVSKIFSEGMVVKAFVNGLNNGETDGGRVGLGYDQLMEMTSVESTFHLWMK